MEPRSVEMADVVVSPSQFMVNWLKDKQWNFPPVSRVKILPNILLKDNFQTVPTTSTHTIRDIEEVIYFGKFDALKGIDLFLDAIEYLQSNYPAAVKALKKVTIMGRRVSKIGNMEPKEYFASRFHNSSFRLQVIEQESREYYWSYLRSRNQEALVVFPSRIENSPTVVMESFMNDVCFLASDVGGTSELIDPRSRDHRLFKRNKRDLAAKVADMLTNGCAPATMGYSFEDIKNEHLGNI